MRIALSITTMALAFVAMAQQETMADVVDNTTLAPPGYYNGTGPIDGGFTVDTEGTVEAGLRASIRGVGPITPIGHLYTAPLGLDGAGTHALWNFDYSVNPGLSADTHAIITILNEGNGQSSSFTDLSVTRVPALLGDATNGNGYQNSENLQFSFLGGPLGFDANAVDTYEITLSVLNGDNVQLASVTIDVAAVPEASTWAMMILGFCGIGCMAYRRKLVRPRFA